MVPPLVAPLVPIPAFAGLGSGLQVPSTVPAVDTIGVPSECLLLKNMFDPTHEVGTPFHSFASNIFIVLLLLFMSYVLFLGRRNQTLIWISKKMFKRNVLSLEI